MIDLKQLTKDYLQALVQSEQYQSLKKTLQPCEFISYDIDSYRFYVSKYQSFGTADNTIHMEDAEWVVNNE